MEKAKTGFTLIELLIVIAIIAAMATAVVVVLNPAEILRQARDSTRISDLSSLHSAIALYVTDVLNPSWVATTTCSAASTTSPFSTSIACGPGATPRVVNGNGWVNGIDFTKISGGSPLPTLPLDPTNTGAFIYFYRASSTVGVFELNANLESSKYAPLESNSSDGGDNNNFYEVGTNLQL